jgi:hypothetical protein
VTVPALPLDDAGPYVAAAYLVFLALILIYVAIMASKLVRIARDLDEVADLVERRTADAPGHGDADAGAEPGETAQQVVPR